MFKVLQCTNTCDKTRVETKKAFDNNMEGHTNIDF